MTRQDQANLGPLDCFLRHDLTLSRCRGKFPLDVIRVMLGATRRDPAVFLQQFGITEGIRGEEIHDLALHQSHLGAFQAHVVDQPDNER